MSCARTFPFLLIASASIFVLAQQPKTSAPPDARWSFQSADGAAPADAIHAVKAESSGNFQYVQGAIGEALRFDGYTTSLTVPRSRAPQPGADGFTVEAWVALNTLPWNWVPIADEQSRRQAGFFFGIDAFGHLGVGASINGEWKEARSTGVLPLKRWTHVAGVYQTHNRNGTLTVYIDGVNSGELHIHGELSESNSDLLIGRVRQAVLPYPEAEVKPAHPILFSLDGSLDELTFYSRGLSSGEIVEHKALARVPGGNVLPWVKMPSGPATPGRFGAYRTTLKYEDAWERLRQIEPGADVVVRFDNSPSRLVFWQGTNYIPAWVTGDDKWYTDEFLEVWDFGCPDGGDCEPMSDKQGRFSHVEILESNEARAVVHWRYALVEAVGLKPAWSDPVSGFSDWADEYWTVYPDGIAVRKQVLHSSHPKNVHEWQETIVLHQPGSRPEDNINDDAVTLENMRGETKTYSWKPHAEGVFADPLGPPSAPAPAPSNPNIQWVNLKSRWKPFQVVPPDGASADFYNNEKSFFTFECWNHWPVAQIASSDRPCVSNDRPSHSSLSHLFWKTYAETENSATKLLLDGLTTKTPAELLPIAKSWTSPAELRVEGAGVASIGFDPTQRAYVLSVKSTAGKRFAFDVKASEDSPLYNPAFLLQDWGEADAAITIEGLSGVDEKHIRVAHLHQLQSSDLLVWVEAQTTHPIRVTLSRKE